MLNQQCVLQSSTDGFFGQYSNKCKNTISCDNGWSDCSIICSDRSSLHCAALHSNFFFVESRTRILLIRSEDQVEVGSRLSMFCRHLSVAGLAQAPTPLQPCTPAQDSVAQAPTAQLLHSCVQFVCPAFCNTESQKYNFLVQPVLYFPCSGPVC